MPRRLLTVSELIDCCSPPTEERRSVWLRRARDWSNVGLLPASAQEHEGSGRHRRYRHDTVYLASVLLRMADLGVSIGDLARISDLIRTPGRTTSGQRFKAFWEAAKTHSSLQPAYIAIAPGHGTANTQYITSFGPIHVLEDRSWAMLNLTQTFRALKL
jgi:DNA-binding transcriptional MerR regulator